MDYTRARLYNSAMPARIAFLFEFPTVSGGEAAALELMRRLDRARFDPVALAPPQGALAEALRAGGIALCPLTIKEPGGNPLPKRVVPVVARAAAEAGAAVLHANSLALARYTGPAGEDAGIPALAHCRDIMGLSAAKARDVARNRRLIAVSRAVERSLVGQGIPAERIELVPDGIDFARAASGRPGRLRAELGLPADVPLVGCIGQISLRKGQDVLIEAVPLVLAGLPDTRFLVVGARFSKKPEVREYEAALHRRVAELGLGERVHFLGRRDDVADVMADLDAVAHPAHEEPQSIALLEAMAANRPLVATAVGGTPELVEDGVSGLLVPPKDPRALADALLRVLRDRAFAAGLAAAGRERARSAFRPEDAAARVQALYEVLLART